MKHIWLVGLFLLGGMVSAQDPHFTQFYANALYLAPSFAGATEQHRISGSFRDQWPTSGVKNTFVTYTASYDHCFSAFNSGIGILFMNDVAGTGGLKTMNFGLQYSYDFQIFHFWHIRPGVSFIFKERTLSMDKLAFYGDIFEYGSVPGTTEGSESHRLIAFDASTSILVYADKIWFGSCVDHLPKPEDAFYEKKITPIKVSLFGGYQIVRKGRLLRPIDETVSVAFHYKNQRPMDQLDFGLYWYNTPLVFGLWYRGIPIINRERVGDMIAVLVGAKIPNFSIGYSYDFTISRLVGQTGGAHEVSLVYEFKTSRRRRIHAIPCPEF